MHDLEGQDLNAYMVKQNLEKRVYLSRLGTLIRQVCKLKWSNIIMHTNY